MNTRVVVGEGPARGQDTREDENANERWGCDRGHSGVIKVTRAACAFNDACGSIHVMRLLIALVLLSVSWFPGQALADSEVSSETVNLVVRDPDGAHQMSADGDLSRTGWTRIVIPVDGTIAATIEDVAARLGTEVVVERRYRLLGPEL